jgi:hypothetical protein
MAQGDGTLIDGIASGGSFVNMMKRLQPQKKVDRLWKLKYPLLSRISKKADFFGSQIDCPLEFDHPMVGRTFASAQSNSYPSSNKKFNLTRKKMYGVGLLDAETMHSSANEKGAWIPAFRREMENVVLAMQKRTAINLGRDFGGSIGQISVIGDGDGTNDRLTLKLKSDVINFSVGQAIVSDSQAGTGSSDALTDTDTVVVRKLDFDNGYVYVGSGVATAANITTVISNCTNDWYLFNVGDFANGIHGIGSWVPLTAPSSGESYLGMDRSTDPNRLAGHRLNDTSMSIEEIIQELAARIAYSGGTPDLCVVSPVQMKQLALELDSKVVRDPGGKGDVGFSGILVHTAAGTIEVLGDPSMREDRLHLLDMSTWVMHHLKGLPHLVEDDGLRSMRVTDADQIEFRYRSWCNVACTAPGKNGVAALAVGF